MSIFFNFSTYFITIFFYVLFISYNFLFRLLTFLSPFDYRIHNILFISPYYISLFFIPNSFFSRLLFYYLSFQFFLILFFFNSVSLILFLSTLFLFYYRDFIVNLVDHGTLFDEVIMNLPQNATDFLDVFIGLSNRKDKEGKK